MQQGFVMLPFTLCLGINLNIWTGLAPVCIVPGLKYRVILLLQSPVETPLGRSP